MILITGPTGSGKTTTLYSAIHTINSPDINIMTAEDPVEYNLKGVNQVQVNDEIGRTFAACLRSFLRQDPDVILVGETRDLETAQIGIRAALTGHLVLSTLHTNDCPSTPARLLDMGIPPFLVSSSLQLILAQRLGRRDLQRLQGALRGRRGEPGALRARAPGARHRELLQGQGLPDLQLHRDEGPGGHLRGHAGEHRDPRPDPAERAPPPRSGTPPARRA